jgi:putative tryptophan/tyrosine transport system substrate-binding protein
MMTTRAALAAALALGLLAAPLAAPAQQPPGKTARIGFLFFVTSPILDEEFRQGLRELGYVEGRNIAIEYRSAEGSTIPIVFAVSGDPVAASLVASLARPGGNITGLASIAPEIVGKQLELLKEAAPKVSRVAVLQNPSNHSHPPALRPAEGAARALGVQLHIVQARTPPEVDAAFAAMRSQRVDGVLVLRDALFLAQRTQLAALAAKNRLPAVYGLREEAEAGGLMAYGASAPQMFRRAATYVDKILKGAKPAELPVEQPTKYELVINLKTASTLGLTIPPSLLRRADQIIE